MIRLTIFSVILLIFIQAGTSPAMTSDQPLRAGVASMITPVSAVKYYQEVVEYLGAKLGKQAKMIHRTTYDEIDIMLEDGQLDVAFICSSPYVLDNKKFGVELLVAPQVKGQVTYNSHIIVHRDSPIETFEQLQNKSFAFVDPKSNTGKLYPTYLLAEREHTPDSFFGSQMYSYSHNKSVELVAKMRVDGAAVDSIVYDFMVTTGSPYAEQTKIIDVSPPFGIPPVVVPAGTPFHLKNSLKSIFLEMHNDPRGRKILEQMRIDKFVEVPDINYDSIRAMQTFVENKGIPADSGPGPSTITTMENAVVLFGILPRDNPIVAYGRYQPLVDYLTKTTGIKTELHLEKNYQGVVNSLGQGRISLALLGPLTYLDAFKRYKVIPIARSQTSKGESFYRSAIVADSGIETISQLANKKFAFASLWSTSGNLLPRYMLAQSGIHLSQLSSYQHFNYHDTVAKKVIGDEYDAGALRLSTAERYIAHGLKIIAVSDPIPTGPVAASRHTPNHIIEKFKDALLTMSSHDEGQKILMKLDPDLQGGFVTTSDNDYAGVRKMINDVPKTCGLSCHPRVSF